MTHEEAVTIVKSQFIKVGKGVLSNALFVWIPPLKVPPFNLLVNLIVDKIMGSLADNGEIGAFFVYVNFNVDSQGRAFMEAAINNHNVQMNGSEEEKKIAENNLKDAFRKLIRFSN